MIENLANDEISFAKLSNYTLNELVYSVNCLYPNQKVKIWNILEK